jgi:hypothetical protein
MIYTLGRFDYDCWEEETVFIGSKEELEEYLKKRNTKAELKKSFTHEPLMVTTSKIVFGKSQQALESLLEL